MIFLSSDHHFWHSNVIKYCARPFNSVEEMNEMLVLKWNEVVPPEGIVYYLGDFSMAFRAVETFSHRLNGRKVLIPGNHDFCHSFHKKGRDPANRAIWIQKYADHGWEVRDEKSQITLNLQTLDLCHHPFSDNSGTDEDDPSRGDKYENWRPVDGGNVLLCGHVHEKWKTKRSPKGTLQINVGCDVWNYTPVSLTQIADLIELENGKKE